MVDRPLNEWMTDNILKLKAFRRKNELILEENSYCGIVFGRLYTSHGILPDPKMIEHILLIPVPQDQHDLQRSLGMVNFLSPHLPNISQLTTLFLLV